MSKLTKVEFTNLGKVLYPSLGIKKSQIIKYYIRIAPKMLKFLSGRAIVMARFPDGIGKGFYEKDSPVWTPSWVRTFAWHSKNGRKVNYIVCDDLDTLLWLANIAALEINITLSKVDRCENPDLILFDIDPSQPASFKDAADVSLILKEKLDDLGLKSYVKTTGKRGLHVVVPIVEEYPFEKTREFSHQIGIKVAKECEIAVSEFSQSKTPGKVFIDYLQNAPGKTMIAPYSLRAVESATISMPLEWKEVKKLKQFNIFSTRRKNPWEKIFEEKQKL